MNTRNTSDANELDMSKPHAFLWVCLRCFVKDIGLMAPPRLAMICFTYSQTFLLERAVDLLSQPLSAETESIGYALIGATFLIYTGIAVGSALAAVFHEKATEPSIDLHCSLSKTGRPYDGQIERCARSLGLQQSFDRRRWVRSAGCSNHSHVYR